MALDLSKMLRRCTAVSLRPSWFRKGPGGRLCAVGVRTHQEVVQLGTRDVGHNIADEARQLLGAQRALAAGVVGGEELQARRHQGGGVSGMCGFMDEAWVGGPRLGRVVSRFRPVVKRQG